ncbi:MAG: cytochrome c [Acidobacteriota bacterium]|nr:cytochrome c [Acidobacteriota bacterium]
MNHSRSLLLALIASLAASAAVAAPLAANANDTTPATWAEHVAPILYENCASCHRPGQTAPMSLLSYDEARPWAKSIRKVTTERTMPPWFADPEHGEFVEDPSLTDSEIDALTRWVAAGAPAGDLSKAPEPPSFSSEWKLGQPDAVFVAPEYEVSDDVEDHYQWLQVDNPGDEERWIRAIEIHPGLIAAVHHQLTYLAPPEATLQGVQSRAGALDLTFVGGWGPGVAPLAFADGHGMRMPPNSSLFFQMHYHKDPGPGTGGIDQTSMGLYFHDDKPENVVETLWLVDPALNIPPGDSNYHSWSSFTTEHEAVLFDYTPHMHLRGKAMTFTAEYPNGEKEILLDVPSYDFNWQLTYTPTEPKVLPAGTTIRVDAKFDNSADNPANPDPTANVTFGEKTTDEMMVGFIHYTFSDRSQQVDMPTFIVPDELKEQVEQIRQFRQQQREAKAAESGG